MPSRAPDPRVERDVPTIVRNRHRPVVLPDEFAVYVEILSCADPDAYLAVTRELAAADAEPAAAAAAAHLRRIEMLASLERALAGATEEPGDVAAGSG